MRCIGNNAYKEFVVLDTRLEHKIKSLVCGPLSCHTVRCTTCVVTVTSTTNGRTLVITKGNTSMCGAM